MMIIQCDQCNTKFKLDDSRVTENGVRVRCSRCKHTFVVRKEIPEVEPDYEMVLQGLGDASDVERSQTNMSGPLSSESSPGEETGGEFTFAEKSGMDDSSTATFPETPPEGDAATSEGDVRCPEDADAFGPFSFERQTIQEQPAENLAGDSAPPVQNEDRSSTSDLSLPLPTPSHSAGEGSGQEDVSVQSGFTGSSGNVLSGNQSGELDWEVFSKGPETEMSVPPVFQEEHFSVGALGSNNPDFRDAEASHDTPAVFPTSVLPQGAEDHIIFPGMNGEKTEEPADDSSSVASGITTTTDPLDRLYVEVPQVAEDELPPLNITSRRKGYRLQSGVVAVLVLAAVCLVAWGAYSLSGSISDMKKLPGAAFFDDLLGHGAKESRGIVVKKLDGSFLANKEAGEVFAIRGEVFNQSDRSHALSQVKCVVYGAGGEVLLQKPAKCGILLTDEQLAGLPMDMVEESMRNQTANSAQPSIVPSGRGVSFVAVFRNVPRSAGKYGAEVVAAPVSTQ